LIPPTTDAASQIRPLVEAARQALQGVATYQVALTRQERVGDRLQPAEDVVLSVRRAPKAVRLEWPDGPHKGREVLYAADQNGGLMQINMPGALVPRMSLAPDSPMVSRTSRHPITEAGLDSVIDQLEAALAPGADRLTYDGREPIEPGGPPCDKVVRVTTQGETWVVYLDPTAHLPALVQATAANGDLLERYRFRDLRTNPQELAEAGAFDPAVRWGPPKGMLQRLARSNPQ
jgi:hypothetical protein